MNESPTCSFQSGLRDVCRESLTWYVYSSAEKSESETKKGTLD